MTTELDQFHDDFDMKSPAFSDRFEDILTDLLARCPVAHGKVDANNRLDKDEIDASVDFWVVTEFDEIRRCARKSELFSSARGGILVDRPPGLDRQGADEADPPEHTAVRNVVNRFFSPGAIERMSDRIRDVAIETIDSFRHDGTCNVIPQLSSVVPSQFFFRHILNVDGEGEAARMVAVTDRMLRGEHEAGRQYAEWCRQFLRARKAGARRGDVVDALLDMQIEGKPEPFEQIYQVFNNITIGGLETTSWAIARSIHFLAINPEIRERLAARPENIPAAVEESLRLLSPVWYLGRTATADTTIGNRAVSRGDFVILCFAAANRDPKVFDDPGRWDMGRPVQRHIAFGAGRHRCLGSHLARLEMVIVLEELLRRIPEFEMAPGCDVTVTTTNTVRRPSEVRIVFPVRHR